jgi:hypothetical protein
MADRFPTRYVPEPNSGCWLWLGGLTTSGYGHFWNGTRSVLAHRHAYEKLRGTVPAGLYVLHRCDVRCCVNPDHLFLGTNEDNMADMASKGRRRGITAGEDDGRAKLTAEDVRSIRESSLGLTKIAHQYGLNRSHVYAIRAKKVWVHV